MATCRDLYWLAEVPVLSQSRFLTNWQKWSERHMAHIFHISSINVLCIDDQPPVIQTLRRMLSSFFFGQFTRLSGIFGGFSFEQPVEFAFKLLVGEIAACVLVAEASKWVC